MSKWYLLNHQTFCFQTWYCEASLWVRVSCKKIDLLFSKSSSLQELISKYDNFYCIFWTADHFATKLGLIVHYHKPECSMEKFYCCAQGQGHSKILEFNEWSSRRFFSESLNFLLPNVVWWCIIMSQIVFQKDWLLSSRSSHGYG